MSPCHDTVHGPMLFPSEVPAYMEIMLHVLNEYRPNSKTYKNSVIPVEHRLQVNQSDADLFTDPSVPSPSTSH